MIAILDNLRSISNTGSIFRTADAAGVKKLYLGGITPEPFDVFGRPSAPFVKVSLGAEKSVAWEKAKSVSRLIDRLKKEGYKVIAVELAPGAVPYNRLNLGKNLDKVALVFGNEVDGVSKKILAKCDIVAEVPMAGMKESMNVAVTFGIVVFQLVYNP